MLNKCYPHQVELILEQMRLCLAKKDFIRTQIISKKISVKFFEEKDTHDLKLKFYRCSFRAKPPSYALTN